LLLVLLSVPAAALTLDDAVAQALSNSKAGQLAHLKEMEAAAGLDRAQRERFPTVTAFGTVAYVPNPYQVKLGANSLTSLLDSTANKVGLGYFNDIIGPFPPSDLTLMSGSRDVTIGGILLLQPLTQQWRIGSGITAARADQEASLREEFKANAQIRFSVEEIFTGLLVEGSRHAALEAKLAFKEAQLSDALHSKSVGELLDDSVLGLQAERTQCVAALTRNDQLCRRMGLQLGDLIGRPGAAVTDLDGALPERATRTLDQWLADVAKNPDRQIAMALIDKASAGLRASRQAEIPDLALFATGYSQDGIGLLPTNSAIVGVVLKWDLLDFGRRRADIQRSLIQRREAEVSRDRTEEQAALQVRLAYQDLTYAGDLMKLGEQARTYRLRSAQLASQNVENGLALNSHFLAAQADLREAEADLLDARMRRHLALLQLYLLTGEL
jgi:outer membrane protein TolC